MPKLNKTTLIKMVPALYCGETIGFLAYYPDGTVKYLGVIPLMRAKHLG